MDADKISSEEKIQRFIEESVPGKQVTLAHVIASPILSVYESLGIEHRGAIGILALTPYESAIIAADVASKAANVEIAFLDRFTGSVLINGDVESVETALQAVVSFLHDSLGFSAMALSRS
ncbi:BMC domain-containing protein [Lactovum odontotermitis]